QRLQTLCPRLGKLKIAQTLARAGLHLGVTTVARLRRQKTKPPAPPVEPMPFGPARQRQTAEPCLACGPHHGADLPRLFGFVAALFAPAILAVLLVVGRRGRSFFAPRARLHSLQTTTGIQRRAPVPWHGYCPHW